MSDKIYSGGCHLLGIGTPAYNQAAADYAEEDSWTDELMTQLESAEKENITVAENLINQLKKENSVNLKKIMILT